MAYPQLKDLTPEQHNERKKFYQLWKNEYDRIRNIGLRYGSYVIVENATEVSIDTAAIVEGTVLFNDAAYRAYMDEYKKIDPKGWEVLNEMNLRHEEQNARYAAAETKLTLAEYYVEGLNELKELGLFTKEDQKDLFKAEESVRFRENEVKSIKQDMYYANQEDFDRIPSWAYKARKEQLKSEHFWYHILNGDEHFKLSGQMREPVLNSEDRPIPLTGDALRKAIKNQMKLDEKRAKAFRKSAFKEYDAKEKEKKRLQALKKKENEKKYAAYMKQLKKSRPSRYDYLRKKHQKQEKENKIVKKEFDKLHRVERKVSVLNYLRESGYFNEKDRLALQKANEEKRAAEDRLRNVRNQFLPPRQGRNESGFARVEQLYSGDFSYHVMFDYSEGILAGQRTLEETVAEIDYVNAINQGVFIRVNVWEMVREHAKEESDPLYAIIQEKFPNLTREEPERTTLQQEVGKDHGVADEEKEVSTEVSLEEDLEEDLEEEEVDLVDVF